MMTAFFSLLRVWRSCITFWSDRTDPTDQTDRSDKQRLLFGTQIPRTRRLMQGFPGRIIFSRFIQRLAVGEAFLEGMPVEDFFFAELPTEKDFLVFQAAVKINEADVQVFHDAPQTLNIFHAPADADG